MRARIVWIGLILATATALGAQSWEPPNPSQWDPIDYLWFPAYQTPDAYFAGDVAAYRSDLDRAFKDDPSIATQACAWGGVRQNDRSKRIGEMNDAFQEACKELKPIDKNAVFKWFTNEDNLRAHRDDFGPYFDHWLAEAWTLTRAKVTALSPAERWKEREAIGTSFQNYGDRIKAGMLILAIDPGDDRGAYLPETVDVRYLPASSDPERLWRFLATLPKTPGLSPDDAHRIERNLDLYRGSFDDALTAASLIGRPTERDNLARAALQGFSGDSNPVQSMVASCPPPDDYYRAILGERPAESWCRDVATLMAARAIEALGEHVPLPVEETFFEINRHEYGDFMVPQNLFASLHFDWTNSPILDLLSKVSAPFGTAADRASRLSMAEREKEFYDAEANGVSGGEAIGLIALYPQNDIGPYHLVRLFTGPEYPDPALRKRDADVLKIMEYIYRKQINGRDNPLNWLMGFRGFLYYQGRYAESREINKQILAAQPKDPQYSLVFQAVLDLALGDRSTYDALLAHPPVAPTAWLDAGGRADNFASGVSQQIIDRGVDAAGSAASASLKEMATKDSE